MLVVVVDMSETNHVSFSGQTSYADNSIDSLIANDLQNHFNDLLNEITSIKGTKSRPLLVRYGVHFGNRHFDIMICAHYLNK